MPLKAAIGNYENLSQLTNANLQAADLLFVEQEPGGSHAMPVSEFDKRYVQQPTGGTGAARVVGGTHVPTSGEASATMLSIVTGLTTIIGLPIVQVVTTSTGKVATSDAAISVSGGTLTIANGASFTLATTQTISWIAVGS